MDFIVQIIEKIMKVIHIKNEYIIEGDVTKIVLRRKDGNNFHALVDTEDLGRLKTFNNAWCASYDKHVDNFYVHAILYKDRKDKNKRCEKIALQCYIMNSNPETGEQVDHINHNTLDNRKNNLRIIYNRDNTKHKRGANKNSKTGVRNVHWIEKERIYKVQIMKNYIRYAWDFAESQFEEACKFAKKKREELFGEFAGES